jgi:hypothetical protein
MIKKTIKYKNLDGVDVQEDFWFKITPAEFVKRAMSEGGDSYIEKLQRLSDLSKFSEITQSEIDLGGGRGREIMDTFETILRDAVGRREGDLLIKDETAKNRFMYSGAYDKFFMELITGEDSGALFFTAVLPSADQIQEALKEINARRVAEGKEPVGPNGPRPVEAGKDDDQPKWLQEGRYATQQELLKAGPDETRLAMKMKSEKAFG